MSRRYFRQTGGRFRGPTLADFGMVCCPQCGMIYDFRPALDALGTMPDPRDMRLAREACPACDGSAARDTGLRVVVVEQEVAP
ncbi:MAG TPA: hypothetical protein DCQ64_23880 [Candidatus Rokubacteria bacterium]|nr:hypothetical protein [Candidatus Rokubacteria bacterium]